MATVGLSTIIPFVGLFVLFIGVERVDFMENIGVEAI